MPDIGTSATEAKCTSRRKKRAQLARMCYLPLGGLPEDASGVSFRALPGSVNAFSLKLGLAFGSGRLLQPLLTGITNKASSIPNNETLSDLALENETFNSDNSLSKSGKYRTW